MASNPTDDVLAGYLARRTQNPPMNAMEAALATQVIHHLLDALDDMDTRTQDDPGVHELVKAGESITVEFIRRRLVHDLDAMAIALNHFSAHLTEKEL